MPKASVDITTTSREEIVALLSDWGLGGQVGDFTKCYGGFSGSNYAVSLHDGRKLLLKCTNDQPKADVEAQVSALLFLRSASTAPPTCYPWPLGGGGSSCGSGGVAADYVSMRTGSPSIVLDFLAGGPADKVLASAGGAGAPVDVVRRIFGGAGGALAQLHSVALPPDAEVATAGIRDAGGAGRFPGADLAAACFVGQQPAFVAEFAGEASLEGHPFLPLHAESVGELVSTMQADVPRGFIHGDPFLDNLLSEADGSVVGWIDWEDVAVGPLMFDVGCAIIGCCYRSADGEDNALDVARIAAFLRAYVEVRALSPTESRLLLPFMRLALLCNATWRFRNFNLVHTGPETAEARDSYKELAERLTGLKQPEAISQVERILADIQQAVGEGSSVAPL